MEPQHRLENLVSWQQLLTRLFVLLVYDLRGKVWNAKDQR